MKSSLTLSVLALTTALATTAPAYAADNNVSAGSTRRVIDSGGPVDWASQDNYWRKTYPSRPYYSTSRTYNTYEPAYRYGADIYAKNPGVSYDMLDQAQLRRDWEQSRGTSKLSWDDANSATRDAYNRLYENRNKTTESGAPKAGRL